VALIPKPAHRPVHRPAKLNVLVSKPLVSRKSNRYLLYSHLARTITPYGQAEESFMPMMKSPALRGQAGAANRRPGVRSLGIGVDDSLRIVRLVQAGFPFSRLARFQKVTALTWEKIARFVAIPQRTLTRRQIEGKLQPDESDRLWRASAIFDMAVDLFEGDVVAARQWLLSPQAGLGGEVPLDFASTEVGAREVENLIGRLEHGVFT
jgi:putative toxin-antitoxin system antitoxin component (TIGR02293 family)